MGRPTQGGGGSDGHCWQTDNVTKSKQTDQESHTMSHGHRASVGDRGRGAQNVERRQPLLVEHYQEGKGAQNTERRQAVPVLRWQPCSGQNGLKEQPYFILTCR